MKKLDAFINYMLMLYILWDMYIGMSCGTTWKKICAMMEELKVADGRNMQERMYCNINLFMQNRHIPKMKKIMNK